MNGKAIENGDILSWSPSCQREKNEKVLNKKNIKVRVIRDYTSKPITQHY